MFSSMLQVLTVESETRKSKKTGADYSYFAARCILLDDSFQPINVGVIRSQLISPALRETVAPGLFRATFSLGVPDYGDSKGDIVALVTQLVPVAAPKRSPEVSPVKG